MRDDYNTHRSPLMQIADEIITWELIWPLPLLAVGILGMQHPVVTSTSVVLALIPWITRWLVFGRTTRQAFLAGPLGLLGISGLVGIWASYDPTLSWPMLLTLLGSINLFFVMVNSNVSPRSLGSVLVILAGLMAFYFAGQYAHFDYQEGVGRLGRLGRMTGSLMPDLALFIPHPNAIAVFLESVLLLNLVLAWRARGLAQLAWGLAAIVIAYGLLISGSRGSWIGLAVAVGLWAMALFPNWKLRLGVVAIGAVGGVVVLYIATGLFAPKQPSLWLDSTLANPGSRLVLYWNSFNLLGDYPFTGIGLGDTFAMVYSRYQLLIPVPFLTYSHNLFLAVALGMGVLGITALVWLLVEFYRFVFLVERAGLSIRSRPLFRAVWLGTTATFVHGLTDSPQFSGSRWTMPMLFAMLGLTIMIGRPAIMINSQKERQRQWRWAPLAVGAGALILAAVFFLPPLLSIWHANLGAVYQTQADLAPNPDEAASEAMLAKAMTHFERALSLNPSQPVSNRRLGMIALDSGDFEAAVTYLERAYPQEETNQATKKALGYAYLWTGQLDLAEAIFRQVQFQSELVKELGSWNWWWGKEGQTDLSLYASEMQERLSSQK